MVTTYRGREGEAAREVRAHLTRLGDASPRTRLTEVTGLVLGSTSLDAVEASRGLASLASSEPWSVRLVLRFVPIQAECRAEASEIANSCSGLVSGIAPEESFRVTVEARHSSVEKDGLIRKIASLCGSKVDLEDPAKVVLVEIVGPWAGISVLKPEDVFSAVRTKRGF
ncbi:MAG: THUMP domain-containing protein [Nitrososphaerota archaeon]|nr:THUMP domain-containing protein [Nitrososphaerota archaeon]